MYGSILSTAFAIASDSILVIIKIEKTVVQNSIVLILLKLGCIIESIIESGISNSRFGPTSYDFPNNERLCISKKLNKYTNGIERAMTHMGPGKRLKTLLLVLE